MSFIEVLLIGLGVIYVITVWRFSIKKGTYWFLIAGFAYVLSIGSLSGQINQNVIGWSNIGVFVLGIYLPALWMALEESFGNKSTT